MQVVWIIIWDLDEFLRDTNFNYIAASRSVSLSYMPFIGQRGGTRNAFKAGRRKLSGLGYFSSAALSSNCQKDKQRYNRNRALGLGPGLHKTLGSSQGLNHGWKLVSGATRTQTTGSIPSPCPWGIFQMTIFLPAEVILWTNFTSCLLEFSVPGAFSLCSMLHLYNHCILKTQKAWVTDSTTFWKQAIHPKNVPATKRCQDISWDPGWWP